MAQLANSLRIILSDARIEKTGGRMPWQRKTGHQDVWMDWRAVARRREGADWVEETLSEGRVTGAEIMFWADWFANATRVRDFPAKLGPVPTIPVARLWTPLAGAGVEFFLWADASNSLVLMALFTPDEDRPDLRRAVETSVSPETLAAFGQSLAAEYESLRAALS